METRRKRRFLGSPLETPRAAQWIQHALARAALEIKKAEKGGLYEGPQRENRRRNGPCSPWRFKAAQSKSTPGCSKREPAPSGPKPSGFPSYGLRGPLLLYKVNRQDKTRYTAVIHEFRDYVPYSSSVHATQPNNTTSQCSPTCTCMRRVGLCRLCRAEEIPLRALFTLGGASADLASSLDSHGEIDLSSKEHTWSGSESKTSMQKKSLP